MKNKNTGEFVKKYAAVIEAAIGILAVAFLIYEMRSLLLSGETTLIHDNLLWNYPIFQFFAENVIHGHFPFWDPFSHAGEPFYPILGQVRLLEPTALLVIYFGKLISADIVMLFNWNRFIQSLVMAFGVYIVLRPLAGHLFIRLSLIPILLYSSFMLGSFRQDAILNQFLWVPFVTYFLLRIVYYKDYRWHNWLMLAGVIGLNWQSYFFTGTWVFLLFFSVGIIFFRKDLLKELFKARMVMPKLVVAAFIVLAMAMPNIVLMLERDKYVFPARMTDFSKMRAPEGGPLQYEAGSSSVSVSGINMPYKFIAFTGTFSNIWDFIQMIAPDGSGYIRWPRRNLWGRPSEAYMYLGLLPWAIAILGLVAGRHDLKRVWLLILLAFGLLMLGPSGGVHRLLYYAYPPVWFVRHTHAFVLFFIFAFLYFYVLGFNHIFSTWGSQLFPSNSSQGILGRLNLDKGTSSLKKFMDAITRRKEQCISELQTENNGKDIFRLEGEIKALKSVIELPELRDIEAGTIENSKAIAICIFSICIVMSVYLMTKMAYSKTNYMFGIIALIFIAGWYLRKDLGEKGLYISLIIGHIAIILMFSTNTNKFVRYIIPVLGLPVASFISMKSYKGISKNLERYASLIMLSIFSISLTSDLVYSLGKTSFLYQGENHPGITCDIKTTAQKPFLPQERFIYPVNSVTSERDERGMRYLSLIYRQPFVFSSINEPDYSGSYVQAKDVFKGLKNGSFESWVVSAKNIFLPKQFRYHQDGKGGGVEKYTGYDGVRDGKSSVLLKPSSHGNSYIRYKTSDIDEIKGQYVRISLWVKSQNKTGNAIQVNIQDFMNAPVVKSYNNSGDWEKLTIVKYIVENVEDIAITCNVNSSSTAPAYLDELTIEIVEVNTNTFEYALKAKRWSSFLLLKKYFELVNMDISPLILEEIFAVGKPMFQFKQGIVRVKESEAQDFLKQLGDAKSVELLREAVLVDEQVDQSLRRFRKLPKEYQNLNQSPAVMGNFKGSRDISIGDEKNKFMYAIKRYNYNSFEMKTSAGSDGILYWADGYEKNWHAYVNGKEVPIYLANINFKAISLPKGINNINFTYNPFLFKIGLLVFYGIFIICILLSIIFISRYTTPQPEQNTNR
jgi:hypothetical protein